MAVASYCVATVVVIVVAGCNRADVSRTDTAANRDSARVRVVDNVKPRWTAATAWHLRQLVTIGGEVEPEDQRLLFGVTGALKLGNDNLVVANDGTREVKVFTATGDFVATVGRNGDGPGEFRSLALLAHNQHGGFSTYDDRLRRISVFGADGVFRSSATLPGPRVRAVSLLRGGRLIATGTSPVMPSRDNIRHRDSVAYLLYDTDGPGQDTLVLLPGLEVFRSGRVPGIIPFGRRSLLAARDNAIYAAPNDIYQIGRYDLDGNLSLLIRRPHVPRDITDADVEHAIWSFISELPMSVRPAYREAMSRAPIPNTMPAFDALVIDANGFLWVRDFPSPTSGEPQAWTVFDTAGLWLGQLEAPRNLTIHDIGEDYVVGTTKDSFDIERLVLYRIDKP